MTFIYPGEQVARLTRAARLLVPLTGAALLGAIPVVRRKELRRGVWAHYVLVTFAEMLFLGWLRKWNLLATGRESASG